MTYLIFTLALVYVPYSTTSFFPNCLASASQYAAANSLLVHCIQREEGRPVFMDLTSYKTLLFTQVMQYKASVVNESKTSLLHLV